MSGGGSGGNGGTVTTGVGGTGVAGTGVAGTGTGGTGAAGTGTGGTGVAGTGIGGTSSGGGRGGGSAGAAGGRGGTSGADGSAAGGSASGGTRGGAGGSVPDAGQSDATGSDAASGSSTVVYVSGSSSTIRVLRLVAASGMLESASMTADGGSNPTYLALHPNKTFLYAVNESGANSKILAFAVGPAGALTKLPTNGEAATAPGQGPPHLSVHPSGKWIFAAHYGSGHTTVHPILANGGVGAPVYNDKTATAEAHQAMVDPTAKFLFVPCRTPNTIAQYRIDEATGTLTANNPARVTAPTSGTGPRHMAFHPSGKWAYVLGELNGHVVTYAYDGTTGLLSSPAEIPTTNNENSAAHIVVHPNGRFAFASLRRSNEIVTLTLDAATGRATVSAHQTTMISTPRDFTLDPSGQLLLVANQGSGNVVVFGINDADGTLAMRSAFATSGVSQPQCVLATTLP